MPVQDNDQLEKAAFIDRSAREPAYAQLAAILRHQIATGKFRPGDQLPSEAQLCRLYDVSPMTVRRSINLLADQGVISTAQGRGTYVKLLELSTANFDLTGLQDLFGDEIATDVRLLDVRIVPADVRTANKLCIDVGQYVIYIRRLLTRNKKPICYHRAYLVYDPRRPIVESEMDVTSLQGLFNGSSNSLIKYGELAISATLMNEEEASILEVPVPAAAFHLGHLFYDYENKPTSWGWLICRSDQLRFTASVGIHISE
ncbi:MAG: GntR family transcriptional regulator [Anaerolineae bacterium]|nr:GntR family transcriptional regulator [Anaerolineae bacterium]